MQSLKDAFRTASQHGYTYQVSFDNRTWQNAPSLWLPAPAIRLPGAYLVGTPSPPFFDPSEPHDVVHD
jgi:hypothetical protein